MTIDQLSKTDAIRLFSQIYNTEELYDNKKSYLNECNRAFKRFTPQPKSNNIIDRIFRFSNYLIFLMQGSLFAAAITMIIYIVMPTQLPTAVCIVIFVISLILMGKLCSLISKTLKKSRQKIATEKNSEFELLKKQIYKTESEIDALKDEIERLYNIANIQPPFRNKRAMYYLAKRLKNYSYCSVIQALKDYEEELRAENIAEAKAEAAKAAGAQVASELAKNREAFESAERDRWDMQQRNLGIHQEINDRLDYISDKLR